MRREGRKFCIAVIYILIAEVIGRNLYIEGFWHDKEEGSWKFSGHLDAAVDNPDE